jgi:hypothetical protein
LRTKKKTGATITASADISRRIDGRRKYGAPLGSPGSTVG